MILSFAFLAYGIGAIIFGLRGRQIDYHPLCRKCGFDLTGKPRDSQRCAECGSDLDRRGAIRNGHRVARRGFVWLGGTLTLLSLAAGACIAVVSIKGTDIHPYQPTWYLLRVGDAPSLVELNKRMVKRQLSPSQVRAVIDRALLIQAKPNLGWTTAWGDLVDTAASLNFLAPEQQSAYLRHALSLTLAVKPTPATEESVTFIVKATSRVGSACPWTGVLLAPLPALEDEFVASANVIGQRGFRLGANGAIEQTWILKNDNKTYHPGTRTLRVKAPVRIFDNAVPGHQIDSWIEPLEATWQIAPQPKPLRGSDPD